MYKSEFIQIPQDPRDTVHTFLNILEAAGTYTGNSEHPNSDTAHRIQDALGVLLTQNSDIMTCPFIQRRIINAGLSVRRVKADPYSVCQSDVVFVDNTSVLPKQSAKDEADVIELFFTKHNTPDEAA